MKVLIFGGEKLVDPTYTWFHSAITGMILHGHPGDVAAIISPTEQREILGQVYGHSPPENFHKMTEAQQGEWRKNCMGLMSPEQREALRKMLGKKVVLFDGLPNHNAEQYVKNDQAVIEDWGDTEGDIWDFLGIENPMMADAVQQDE